MDRGTQFGAPLNSLDSDAQFLKSIKYSVRLIGVTQL